MTAALTESDLPLHGSVVAGKYEIVRVIGQGGMGVVYEAKHLRLKQRVAIKMLRPGVLHMDGITPRFEREARTAAHLRGRHVARIFDVDVSEVGLPFMVMEYLVGKDLDAELQERGTLSVMEATGYVLQACVAMEEAHAAGIVHRDLKPANLFLTDETGERVVKVLDFGISKITHEVDAHLTGTFATVGTPLYMSPEQVRSSKDVDGRTDIWSLAVILFESLAGYPPFHGSVTATAAAVVADPTPSLCAVRPDVPIELERVLERALAKLPADRYPDVASLSAALAPFGPPTLPFASLGETSSPMLPPSSGWSGSVRIVPGGARPKREPSSTVADTMLIARPQGLSPKSRSATFARLTVGLGLMLATLAVAVTTISMNHSTSKMRAPDFAPVGTDGLNASATAAPGFLLALPASAGVVVQAAAPASPSPSSSAAAPDRASRGSRPASTTARVGSPAASPSSPPRAPTPRAAPPATNPIFLQ